MSTSPRSSESVDLVCKFGLERYALRYSESPGFVGFPLCPEIWAGNRIPDSEWDREWELLIPEVLQTEEVLFEGDIEFALQMLTRFPLRCSRTGKEERKDWPPGVYLHSLRRLVTGDSAQSVFEDLRRVEAGLDEPVPYLEMLRRQLGRCLEIPVGVRKPRDTKSGDGIATTAFPEWESREAWLLVGDPVECEGLLAYGGRMIRDVPPQVFKLLYFLRGKQKVLSLMEANGEKLIRSESGDLSVGAFKKLISRANKRFRALGARKVETPLHSKDGVCHSSVWIKHAPDVSRIH